MSKFEQIKNDKIIIDIYNKISKFENLDKGWAHHNLDHAKNVANLVEVLLEKLSYSKKFIEEAKIAAILHDTGAIEGKENHALKSYNFAKQYLEDNNIVLENKEAVLEAIKIHSDGFSTNNIIALTLILADKLDIKHTRVAKEGYKAIGMRQLQYIKDILVDINNDNLYVKFICDVKINKGELENFYFIIKVFKAIEAFSKMVNLEPMVFLNDDEWVLFNKVLEDIS